MKLRFYLHSQADKQGKKRIMCEYSHRQGTGENSVRFTVIVNSSSLRVDPDKWIKNTNEYEKGLKSRKYKKSEDKPYRVSSKHPNSVIINRMLDKFEASVYECALKIEANDQIARPKLVRQIFHQPKRTKVFWDAYDEYLLWKSKKVKPITLKAQESSFRSVMGDYEKQFGRVSFGQMDRRFAEKFIHFFEGKQQLSSVKRNVAQLKQFLSWSFDEGYILTEHFRRWEVKGSKAIKPALTIRDIRELYNHRNKFVDRFLLHFWTGTRFNELQNVVHLEGNILSFRKGKQYRGQERIFQVYMLPPAVEIWNEHGGVPLIKNSKGEFIKLNALNRRIKKTAKNIDGFNRMVNTTGGIKPLCQAISSHTGRISLVTCMASEGIPESHISAVVGHASRTMTGHYDKRGNDRGANALIEFWGKVKGEFDFIK